MLGRLAFRLMISWFQLHDDERVMNGNMDRAVKHHIIAANLGDEDCMKVLWKHYSAGNITKEKLEVTLRTHQAALDEMKSPEREAAEAWRKRGAQLG